MTCSHSLGPGKHEDRRSVKWPLGECYFHHVGIEIEGRRLTFTNAQYDEKGIDWHSGPVPADDGGDCFSEVKYDRATQDVADLCVNDVG